MQEIIKPEWYFETDKRLGRGFKFYVGHFGAYDQAKKYWVFQIGLWLFEFGRAY